jgi:methylmalonyl-CoA mutase, N-terminal domain
MREQLKKIVRPSIYVEVAMTAYGASGWKRWAAAYAEAQNKGQVRDADFTTISGLEVDPVYGPEDEDADDRMERIGWPGEFPFTRGLYPSGYRGRPWTIRQFAGFGNAQ